MPNKDCHALDHAKERPVKNRLGAKRFLNSAKLTQQILDGFTLLHPLTRRRLAVCFFLSALYQLSNRQQAALGR